jgi:hypothetical protein
MTAVHNTVISVQNSQQLRKIHSIGMYEICLIFWLLSGQLLQHAHRFFHLGVHVPFYLPWVRENPTSCLTQDPMSDRKKRFSPTLRNIYKKQHGARPCVEKMQLIFIVPPNEELEGYRMQDFLYIVMIIKQLN